MIEHILKSSYIKMIEEYSIQKLQMSGGSISIFKIESKSLYLMMMYDITNMGAYYDRNGRQYKLL